MIAFQGERDGERGLYTMRPDGSDVRSIWSEPGLSPAFLEWSPDGQRIAFTAFNLDDYTQSYVKVVNPDGTGARTLFPGVGEWVAAPLSQLSWSPTSDSVAFTARSTEFGGCRTSIWRIDLDTQTLTNIVPSWGDGICLSGPDWSLTSPPFPPPDQTPIPTPPPTPPPTPTPTRSPIDYFALGDSVASGHGLMDDAKACRRSERAYPYKVLSYLQGRYGAQNVNFHSFACSGAIAGVPLGSVAKADPYKSFHAQVDSVLANLSERPTLVSITIGSNDFEFGDPWNFFHRLYYNKYAQFTKWVDATAFSVQKTLEAEVTRLLQHPNVSVIVTDYANPFNHSSVFFKFGPGNRCLLTDCYSRTEYGVLKLQEAVVNAWVALGRPARMQTTPLHAAFEDHESPRPSCGNDAPDTADTWIQYGDDPESNSYPKFPSWLIPGSFSGDCTHPNEKGAQAYADAVYADALRLGY